MSGGETFNISGSCAALFTPSFRGILLFLSQSILSTGSFRGQSGFYQVFFGCCLHIQKNTRESVERRGKSIKKSGWRDDMEKEGNIAGGKLGRQQAKMERKAP